MSQQLKPARPWLPLVAAVITAIGLSAPAPAGPCTESPRRSLQEDDSSSYVSPLAGRPSWIDRHLEEMERDRKDWRERAQESRLCELELDRRQREADEWSSWSRGILDR